MKRLILDEGDIWRIVGVTGAQGHPDIIQLETAGLVYTPVIFKQRYILYRPVLDTPSGKFGDFHPAQV